VASGGWRGASRCVAALSESVATVSAGTGWSLVMAPTYSTHLHPFDLKLTTMLPNLKPSPR
jgi:hypothetical protein